MTTFGDRPGIMETEYHDENSNKMDYIKTGRKLNPEQSQGQSSTLTAGGHDVENHSDMDLLCVAMRGRNPQNPSDRTKGCLTEQRLEINPSGKTNCLTTVQKYNLIIQLGRGNNKGGFFDHKSPTLTSCSWQNNNFLMEGKDVNSRIKGITIKENGIRPHQGDDKKSGISELKGAQSNGMTLVRTPIQLNPSKESSNNQPYQQNRVYSEEGTAPACMANMSCKSYKVLKECRIRRLTPTECARLQTIPEWYKWECSETQQYKMLGNGWTVEVIKHIFSFLPTNLKLQVDEKL